MSLAHRDRPREVHGLGELRVLGARRVRPRRRRHRASSSTPTAAPEEKIVLAAQGCPTQAISVVATATSGSPDQVAAVRPRPRRRARRVVLGADCSRYLERRRRSRSTCRRSRSAAAARPVDAAARAARRSTVDDFADVSARRRRRRGLRPVRARRSLDGRAHDRRGRAPRSPSASQHLVFVSCTVPPEGGSVIDTLPAEFRDVGARSVAKAKAGDLDERSRDGPRRGDHAPRCSATTWTRSSRASCSTTAAPRRSRAFAEHGDARRASRRRCRRPTCGCCTRPGALARRPGQCSSRTSSVAGRATSRVVELDSGHDVMISHRPRSPTCCSPSPTRRAPEPTQRRNRPCRSGSPRTTSRCTTRCAAGSSATARPRCRAALLDAEREALPAVLGRPRRAGLARAPRRRGASAARATASPSSPSCSRSSGRARRPGPFLPTALAGAVLAGVGQGGRGEALAARRSPTGAARRRGRARAPAAAARPPTTGDGLRVQRHAAAGPRRGHLADAAVRRDVRATTLGACSTGRRVRRARELHERRPHAARRRGRRSTARARRRRAGSSTALDADTVARASPPCCSRPPSWSGSRSGASTPRRSTPRTASSSAGRSASSRA